MSPPSPPDTPSAEPTAAGSTAPTPRTPGTPRAWGWAVAYTLLAIAAATWMSSRYLRDPVRYVLLLDEDGLLEYLTATCFLVAAAVSAWTAWRSRGTRRRVMSLVLAAGFFVVGMEEISWGQRILGIETPAAFAELNKQQELTLHNLVHGDLVTTVMVTGMVLWLIVSALVSLRPALWAALDRDGWPLASLSSAGVFVVVVVLLLNTQHPRFDEATEALLGVALLVWVVERGLGYLAPPPGRVGWLRRGVALAVALGAAGVLAVGLETKRPSWDGWILNYMASKHYMPQGYHAQAAELYRYIHDNPKNLDTESYLLYLECLDRLGRAERKATIGPAAVAYYQTRRDESGTPENTALLARALQLVGDDAEAHRLYDEALTGYEAQEIGPLTDDELAAVLLKEARLLLWAKGEAEAAAKLDRIDDLDPSPRTAWKVEHWVKSVGLDEGD